MGSPNDLDEIGQEGTLLAFTKSDSTSWSTERHFGIRRPELMLEWRNEYSEHKEVDTPQAHVVVGVGRKGFSHDMDVKESGLLWLIRQITLTFESSEVI